MTYRVLVIADAEDDILDIYRYIQRHDSPARAKHVVAKVHETCAGLSTSPERGCVPPELEEVGIAEYLEVHFSPYRMIYRIDRRDVVIYGVLDGRRDIQDLLARRLLR